MKAATKKAIWEAVKRFAATAWTVPAVKSVILTNLIRAGVPATLITVGVALVDAFKG